MEGNCIIRHIYKAVANSQQAVVIQCDGWDNNPSQKELTYYKMIQRKRPFLNLKKMEG
jgi:predicted GTPase